MKQSRAPFSMRLTDEGKELLELIADRRGISQSAVVEQLIRDEAERKGISLKSGAGASTAGKEQAAA